jgi:MFS family permease
MYRRNIWLYYVFSTISGIELMVAFFVLFMLSNNLSMTEVMLLESIFLISSLLLEIPSGAFADNYGRKNSLALSMLLGCISLILFGIGTEFMTFLLAQVLLGIGWALSSGASDALIYDSLLEMKQEERYSRIFGINHFLILSTLAVSSILSGYLVFIGQRKLFFITAAIWSLGIVLALLMKEPPIHKKHSYFKTIANAVRFTAKHGKVRDLIIYYGVFAAISHLAYFIIQPFYMDPLLIGIATFVYFITAAIGGLIILRGKNILNILLIISGVCFVGVHFFGIIPGIILIGVMSLSCGIRDVIVSRRINTVTDSHHRATVISVQNMSKSIVYAATAPLFGYATDILNASTAFLMMGIILVLFFIIRQAKVIIMKS